MAPKKVPDSSDHSIIWEWIGPEEYCRITEQMVRFCQTRGGGVLSEELADRTMDAVARRLYREPELIENFEGKPALWMLKFARHTFMKHRAKKGLIHFPLPSDDISPNEAGRSDHFDDRLEECLDRLDAKRRELILEFYSYGKGAKVAHRRRLSERFGLSLNALRTRTCRIRKELRKCLDLHRQAS